MSNHLAIATVTEALCSVIAGAVGVVTQASVYHVRPGSATEGKVGANVYLYAVTPNAAARNDDLPTRRGNGAVAQRPRAALDLHYLISFYGDDAQLETQRMLGAVVRTLHARPTLSPTLLRNLAKHTDGTTHDWLAGSDLADADEAVRFTPVSLSLEELSKLWSVLFQTPYALSVAYQGTLVSIEADETPAPALPVRGRNVYALPLRRPVIASVTAEQGPGEPIVPTSTLVIRGRGLGGNVRVRLGAGAAPIVPTKVSDRELHVPLAGVAGLRAGVQGVQVVEQLALGTPPHPHNGEESNVAPFVLHPAITSVQHVDGSPDTVNVTLDPPVSRSQRVELLLNAVNVPESSAYRFAPAPASPTAPPVAATVSFPVPGLPAGDYLARVRVDGAESVLAVEADGVFVGPQVGT